MTRYEFPSHVAMDPTLNTLITDGQGFIYALSDQSFLSPLTVKDRFGNVLNGIRTTYNGVTEEFFVDDNPVVWWASGPYAFMVISFTGLQAAALAAQAAAVVARDAAVDAKGAAEAAEDAVVLQPDLAIAGYIANPTSWTRDALDTVIAAVGMAARTADSDQDFRAILLSDGTVKAVPLGTQNPAVPIGLGATAGPSSATVYWNPVPTATEYWLYRDGSLLKKVTSTSYRDAGISGNTYSYQVAAVNTYTMRSGVSDAISVFMDPALNSPPEVTITTWPVVLPTIGSAIVRVNASDVDAQLLSITLGVSQGSLMPTQDPSVWILTL